MTLIRLIRKGNYGPTAKHKPFILVVDEVGIWFLYKGDEVCWVWPWDRRPVKWGWWTVGPSRWYCTSFGGYFPTLQSITAMWKECFEALSKVEEGDSL